MKKITIKEIAQLAGFQNQDIKIFSNPSLVNNKTSTKIKEIVDEYNFVPNSIAQSLAGGATNTIGVVVDELYNSFFVEIIEGLDSILSKNNYFLQMYSSHWDEESELKAVKIFTSKTS